MAEPLWSPTPKQVESAKITKLRFLVNDEWGLSLGDSKALWEFSINEREKFWRTIIKFCDLKAETWGACDAIDVDQMPGARWFPEARFNFAENLLKRRDEGEAIAFWGENGARRYMTFAELYDAVSQLAEALRSEGVGPGDRVAGFLPNVPEAIVSMLAAVSLGATWSSCSPDFGLQGVLDRFGQIRPKVLFACDGYVYNGKAHDIRAKTGNLVREVSSIERVIVTPFTETNPDLDVIPNAVEFADYVRDWPPNEMAFAQMPFDHPLYILFSSGTTGSPKCIVHEAGGMLLKHAVEQAVQFSIGPESRVFWFTTLGWMMWNWLASNLAWGATILLYDGSPFYPNGNAMWDLAAEERMTLFGTSAKYIDACNKAKLKPKETHDLSTLRSIGSTGSPLVPEGFDYIYENIKKDVHLASISGGTDIGGCFCGGDETLPVWRGEIQGRILGMATDVFNEYGESVTGLKGELVCTKAFPGVPSFLDDPDGNLIHNAYFDKFPGVWTHGDFIEHTERGGFIIYGRSDATLNPGGVRIGTAEIYRQVESLEEVLEGIVIGQEWDNDVRVILFVVLREDLTLDDQIIAKIKQRIRTNCTPRHLPARVVQVRDIPRTKSGKITELAVRDIVHGRAIQNAEALANPEALRYFKDCPELLS